MRHEFKTTISRLDIEEYTLVDYLENRFTYLSREDWAVEVVLGNILLNEEHVRPDKRIQMGDCIHFILTDHIEPEVNRDYSILYEDEQLLVINKPPNLPVHPAGIYQTNNLYSILLSKGYNPVFPINRIDRETSGIILFAKSRDSVRIVQKQFIEHTVKKTYITYVKGSFPKNLEANGFLYKDSESKVLKKKKFSPDRASEGDSLECVTLFERIEVKNNISKLYAYPITGRIHQIRTTLFSLGYPVVGDKIYGEDESYFLEFIKTGKVNYKEPPLIQRQALHALFIGIEHPFTKEWTEFTAPEPEDMKQIFQTKKD